MRRFIAYGKHLRAGLLGKTADKGKENHLNPWRSRATTLVAGLGILLAACGPAAEATPTTSPPPATPTPAPSSLTVYSGRAEDLVGPIIKQFGDLTGIKVQVRYGGTSELAATILEEGQRSPADVFFAQDPGGLGAVAGMLSPLPESVLSRAEPRFRSPEGKWVGISGRARVVVYNTSKLKETDLPASIGDFTDPKWKGRIGWPPTNASFQAMVTAMRVSWGEAKTRQWLEGIKANNPKEYRNNTAVVQAVGAGEVDVGFVNHYYLFRFLQEQGEAFPARNYHPKAGDPGAIILVAGAGILSTAKNKAAAQQFLDFMLSDVGQQYFASKTFEYPVVKGINTHRVLVPLEQIESPSIDVTNLADTKGTLELLRQTGVIP
ncbi:MAG: iron ABC transporter substrate-binding protein [Chloroflexi bacterium]|nr:iron ABC transporter substrate-binding protein [Chloroflexota bacterium]